MVHTIVCGKNWRMGRIKNIFKTKEFDGKNYKTKHYNLDAIIATGYRVNLYRAS